MRILLIVAALVCPGPALAFEETIIANWCAAVDAKPERCLAEARAGHKAFLAMREALPELGRAPLEAPELRCERLHFPDYQQAIDCMRSQISAAVRLRYTIDLMAVGKLEAGRCYAHSPADLIAVDQCVQELADQSE